MTEKEQVLTMRKVTERKAVYNRLYIQAHRDGRGTLAHYQQVKNILVATL